MQQLKDIIEKGIITDLIKAEKASSVFRVIGKYSDPINNSSIEIKSTLAYLQELSFNEFILSVSRIYDRKTNRNSTRCIETAIKYLQDNKATLPYVQEKYQVRLNLEKHKAPKYFIESLNSSDSSVFPEKMALYYENELLNIRLTINDLKTSRDKKLAHNEPTPIIRINITKTQNVLDFGWEFVSIIGWAYLKTIYGTYENMFLQRDSYNISHQVEKHILKLLSA